MASPLELLMFDAAVNHGPGGAAKLLQRALNVLIAAAGGQQLKVDGGIGPRTIDAVSHQKIPDICQSYLKERRDLYDRIVRNDPTQQKFLKGWLNRVDDVQKKAGLIAAGLESVEIEPENTPFAGYVD
jgi:lysozyme family protein